jgi:murein DD-endopeptidase MepM/ murein hydrolase activator NlpD
LPERVGRLPRRSRLSYLTRAVGHLAVVALIVSSAGFAVAALHPTEVSSSGLSFDVVSHALGAANGSSGSRSAHFEISANPDDTDALAVRRILPTPTPSPTPAPTAAPKPAAKPAPTPKPATTTRYVAVVGNGRLSWPFPHPIITQYFSAYHLALDLAADAGTPVGASASGTVVSAGWRSNGGGLVVEIDHGNGMHTLYNHLGSITVSVGQAVGRGQQIAVVGCTGWCTGPHVHFQVSVGGVFVNPLRYL